MSTSQATTRGLRIQPGNRMLECRISHYLLMAFSEASALNQDTGCWNTADSRALQVDIVSTKTLTVRHCQAESKA